LATDVAIAPVNLFLHSLFSQVDIMLNGTLVTSLTNTYPYRSMFETLLTYCKGALESQLTTSLFYNGTVHNMDSVEIRDDHAATQNAGFMKRRAIAERSRTIYMIGRLHADIFFQERYTLNEVGVKIELTRCSDAFCLMGINDAKIQIQHASLFVRKIKLTPSAFLAQAKALETTNAKYPIRRVVCKSFTVAQNYRDVNHEKLFSGQLPERIVIGLVNNEAFNGDRAHNPFNFQNYDLSEISLYLDGQSQVLQPIQPNFTGHQYIRAYQSLFAGTGKLCSDEGLIISRDDYPGGYALYAFDLSPDLVDQQLNLVRQGNVRLGIKFRQPLPETVTVVAYAEFVNFIEIDKYRNVVFDFSA